MFWSPKQGCAFSEKRFTWFTSIFVKFSKRDLVQVFFVKMHYRNFIWDDHASLTKDIWYAVCGSTLTLLKPNSAADASKIWRSQRLHYSYWAGLVLQCLYCNLCQLVKVEKAAYLNSAKYLLIVMIWRLHGSAVGEGPRPTKPKMKLVHNSSSRCLLNIPT